MTEMYKTYYVEGTPKGQEFGYAKELILEAAEDVKDGEIRAVSFHPDKTGGVITVDGGLKLPAKTENDAVLAKMFPKDKWCYVLWQVEKSFKPDLYLILWCPVLTKNLDMRPMIKGKTVLAKHIIKGAKEIYATDIDTLKELVGLVEEKDE